jgi:hypothetical protein
MNCVSRFADTVLAASKTRQCPVFANSLWYLDTLLAAANAINMHRHLCGASDRDQATLWRLHQGSLFMHETGN